MSLCPHFTEVFGKTQRSNFLSVLFSCLNKDCNLYLNNLNGANDEREGNIFFKLFYYIEAHV